MNMSGLEAEYNVQSDLMSVAYVLNINLTTLYSCRTPFILDKGQTKLH